MTTSFFSYGIEILFFENPLHSKYELIEVGDLSVLKEVFIQCEWDARGGYSKTTALNFYKIPD
jgi:hypothetical protein